VAAFEATTSASNGPEVLFFKRFKEHWQYIDHDNFQRASTDDSVEALVSSARDNILHIAQVNLEVMQPRDDYCELLELTVLFLGGVPTRGICFQVPSSIHSARWMERITYAIKI